MFLAIINPSISIPIVLILFLILRSGTFNIVWNYHLTPLLSLLSTTTKFNLQDSLMPNVWQAQILTTLGAGKMRLVCSLSPSARKPMKDAPMTTAIWHTIDPGVLQRPTQKVVTSKVEVIGVYVMTQPIAQFHPKVDNFESSKLNHGHNSPIYDECQTQ